MLIENKNKKPLIVFSVSSIPLLRAVEKINYPKWRRILLPHSRRDEASISRYVRFIATKKGE